jgi:hypothetical protein
MFSHTKNKKHHYTPSSEGKMDKNQMCGQKLDRWTEEREDLKIKIKN